MKVVRGRSGKKLIWAAACLLVILVGLSSWYVHKRWNQDVQEGGQAASKVEPPLPAGYSEAPAETPERHDIFDDVDNGTAPQAIPERSASKRHNRRIDPGVDVVLPVGDSVDLLETPDVNAAVVVTASSSDPLPVLQDGHVTGWFHVLHLRSGKTGWVSAEQVQLSKTRHPLPAPQFAEEFTGSDQPPSILIRNQTAYELTVTIRDASYTVRPHTERQISEAPGKARFQAYVAAPDVIPAGGTKEWSVGYKYDWTFWIERSRY